MHLEKVEIDGWESRLLKIEADANNLLEDAASFRRDREQDRDRSSSRREEHGALREAVVRYAVACGAVDVQLAMLRARPAGEGRELAATENLRRAMEEQNEASDALRSLARSLQKISYGGEDGLSA